MESSKLIYPALDEAIATANTPQNPESNWKHKLQQLDERIERLNEQISSIPAAPAVLQDEYRNEIDAVTLENMKLNTKMDETQKTLRKVATAYEDEVKYTKTLEKQLDGLERRLVQLLSKKTIN